jgi:GDP-L-fucose synthase
MKVLVTGASGMLGSALVEYISADASHQVLPLIRSQLDLRDKLGFTSILEASKPDVVIHTAAKVGGIQANIANPFEFLASNIDMDSSVIQSCIASGVRDFLYIGSSCMYPRDYRQPLSEHDILAAPLEPTNEGYALAKIVGSRMCEYASKSLGLNYKTIVPSNLFGPGDNFNPLTSHLVSSVIRKVHEAKVGSQNQINVWGTGRARREFTYIGDLASWITSMLRDIEPLPSVLNVGYGRDYSIDEYYRMAMEVIGHEAELVHDLKKPEGMQSKLLDSSLAREKFGWNPSSDVRVGIERTYEWFLSEKDKSARL